MTAFHGGFFSMETVLPEDVRAVNDFLEMDGCAELSVE